MRAHALLVRLLVKLRAGDPESWRDEAAATITEAMAVFQEAGDDAGLAKAWRLLAWSHGVACHFGLAAEASEKARAHATLAGDVRQQTRSSVACAAGALFGPTPVPEAIERCSLMAEGVSGDRQSEAILLALLASLLAMYGSFERAREHAGQSRAMLEELGLDVELASIAIEAWRVEMLAGEALTAEHELRRAYELLTGMGEKYLLSTVSGLLGQTVYDLGRLDEAEDLGRQSRDLSSDDDVGNQALWRCLLAKVLARQGKPDQAEAYVREALEILAPTDHVLLKYGALLDTAEVLRLAGRDAENELIEARRLARAKGSPTMTKAVEALLLPTPETLVS